MRPLFHKRTVPGLASLLRVAVVVIGRHEALVAPPHVHTAPVHGIVQRAGVHRGEHTVAVGAAGHGDVHTFTIRLGQQIDDGQQRARGHSLRQYLRIGVYNGFTFCHVHSLYYGSTDSGWLLPGLDEISVPASHDLRCRSHPGRVGPAPRSGIPPSVRAGTLMVCGDCPGTFSTAMPSSVEGRSRLITPSERRQIHAGHRGGVRIVLHHHRHVEAQPQPCGQQVHRQIILLARSHAHRSPAGAAAGRASKPASHAIRSDASTTCPRSSTTSYGADRPSCVVDSRNASHP